MRCSRAQGQSAQLRAARTTFVINTIVAPFQANGRLLIS